MLAVVCTRPSTMPATVNTPPTMAEVVVTKWYHGRVCSATMIWMGDRSYENCARAAAAPSLNACTAAEQHGAGKQGFCAGLNPAWHPPCWWACYRLLA